MKFHRDTAIGSDEQGDAAFLQLLEFLAYRQAASRRELKITELAGMPNRTLDIFDDVFRDIELPCRIVELLGILDQFLIIEEPLDCWAPKQRSNTHFCGALSDHRTDVGRV